MKPIFTNVDLGIESSDVEFKIKICADEISRPVLRYIILSFLLCPGYPCFLVKKAEQINVM
jgi:hypothetical protein